MRRTTEAGKKKNDRILIGAVLLLAAALLLGSWLYRVRTTKNGVAVVTVDGETYGVYPLDTELEERIEQEDGAYNILVIRDGKADITEASCRDRICVNHHPAKYHGENIVCLPNKVVVTIENGGTQEVDLATN